MKRFFINRVITRLGKQRNMSPHLGAFLNVYSATAIMFAPLTLIGVATTIYGLWGRDIITEWFPWFSFPMLLGCMVALILLMMVVFFKYVIPSQIAFNMQQNYKHRNPLVRDMGKVLENQKDMKKNQEEINKRLDRLEKKK